MNMNAVLIAVMALLGVVALVVRQQTKRLIIWVARAS